MNEGVTSITPPIDPPGSQEIHEDNLNRRDFLKVATIAGAAAAEAAYLHSIDNTLVTHAQVLTGDIAQVLATEPKYLSQQEYLSFYAEHSDALPFAEVEWTDVIAPGLDKFFNLYFRSSLREGMTELGPVATDMHVDPRNLLVAASYWGEKKTRNEGRVLLEDSTNLAQTAVSSLLDSNLVDRGLSSINPELKPVQSAYSSNVLDAVVPEHMRKLGSKRLRTIGPNDNDARTYAKAIATVSSREQLPSDYFGIRLLNGAKEVAQLSSRLDSERKSGEPSKSTVSNFVQGARVLENQILNDQRNLNFGLKLFTAGTRYREYLIAKSLGQDNLENLNADQRKLVEMILLVSMDDYPNLPGALPYDERFDGQQSRPENIIPGIIEDSKNIVVEDSRDILKPSLWNPAITPVLEFLGELSETSGES